MADLFALLVHSGNSLSAHSAAIATAGHNVANANTPGYARQIANLAANPPVGGLGMLGVGTGVSLESITQARDQFIERQMPNALAAQSRSQSESFALQSVSALNPDLEGGLTSALGAFYSSLRNLAQNPGDLALRQGVLGSSQSLVQSFRQTAASIEAARDGLDADVAGQLNDINASARSLADLNKQIQQVKSTGGNTSDLLDKRQVAIDSLARLTGSTPYTNGRGDVLMALPGGTTLVTDGGAGQLSAVPDAANAGHLKIQLTKADGSGPVDLTGGNALGGKVGGLLAARDGALQTALTALDTFAFDLGTSLNAVHQVGYAMDGTTGRVLFTLPAAAAGAASQISVNAAVAADARLLAGATTLPAASGDNRGFLALIATERQALAGGNDPVESLQQIVTSFGNSSAQATALADHDGAMAAHLSGLRESTAGVSIDEEMINLTKAQKAYEAMAKVISTADSMLDTLMSLK
ncbi:MAG: flagellar hook-associated protein FlgK [Pseudomonadota bacterium]